MLLALINIGTILLTALWWLIIAQVVLSWLVVFNVINRHSDFVRTLVSALDRITEPLYRPIRRILPDFGGLDFSPIIILLLVVVLDQLLRGAAFEVALRG